MIACACGQTFRDAVSFPVWCSCGTKHESAATMTPAEPRQRRERKPSPPPSPCHHFGQLLATLDSAACGCATSDRGVYSCAVRGECTLHAIQRPGQQPATTVSGNRIKIFQRLAVCATCLRNRT